MKQLYFIQYTDTKGQEKTFSLFTLIQNDCRTIGTYFGIETPTLESYDRMKLMPKEKCEKIFDLWMTRGKGEYEVTWAGVLKVLRDADLGKIADDLTKALALHSLAM